MELGTFLWEKISNDNPFGAEIIEDAHKKVIETLLDLGECAWESIKLYGREIKVYDPKRLLKEKDYILEYNRFENDTWEPSFMSAEPEEFTGIRAWSIGSKIGYKQHYMAMATARILCECFSDGRYYVHGDIGTDVIFMCLAYIGKRYGYHLVRNFLANRTNVEEMSQKPDFDKMFLGVRGIDFYIRIYQDMSGFSEWQEYCAKHFNDDLRNVTNGEEAYYCGTNFYLMTLMMKYMCEKELSCSMPKDELLYDLKRFTQKYLIDTVEHFGKNSAIHEFDLSQCDEMKAYMHYYENCGNYMMWTKLADKDVFYATVKHFLVGSNRNDAEEVLAEYHRMLDEMVPSEEEVENLQQYQEQWEIYHISCKTPQDERIRELMEMIRKIDEDDIREKLISDRYLRELVLSDGSFNSMSDGLQSYLADIFSEEREKKYSAAVNDEKNRAAGSETGGGKLMAIAEKLSEDSILFSSELFYRLLAGANTKEGEKILDKMEFYLGDLSDVNKKKAFLWCLQENLQCSEGF